MPFMPCLYDKKTEKSCKHALPFRPVADSKAHFQDFSNYIGSMRTEPV